jgi:DNA-binding transcriptional LysR family regulator
MENLNDLLIFIKVVESGGFSAAASVLQMSTALVSRRLRSLEQEMGVQLLNRSTRHISLTEAGESFYKDCAQALALLDTARQSAVGHSIKPLGTLKVHAAVGIGHWLVTEATTTFKQKYPDIIVDLSIGSERENLLRDGYDVIVKTSSLSDSSLDCREFGPVRHVVVASPTYLRKAGTPRLPEELQQHDCLIQYGRRPANEWYFLGPQGSYAVKVAGTFRSTSAVAICTAARQGLGIAHVPEYVLYNHSEGGPLQVIFDDCVATTRALQAYYPRCTHLPAKVRAFLDCLEQVDARRDSEAIPGLKRNRA